MASLPLVAEVETRVIRAAITRLLDQCKAASGAHRAHKREPFFGSVTVAVNEGSEERRFSCFSRDISPAGIGLLHNMPLPLGEVTLTIHPDFSEDISLRGEVIWCQPCGEGWYLSGVSFTAVCSS
jgi:hypothetical protein